MDLEDDELIIENKAPERPMKNVIRFDKYSERFQEVLNKDPFYDEQPLTELNIDIDKAMKSTKPQVSVPNFNRYEKVKENNNLKKVMEENQKKEEVFQ
mmetsp:Transcript_22576/g.21753  ORF Transcript_22576/g.21753 Transcript_22576/m.21753 type:complete len:98 (+) Transcript_22576:490-783(+)